MKFWLPAVLLYYIPSGIVEAHLAKEMPLEGGMYQWARLGFGPMAGFLVAMNLWMNNVLLISTLGLQMMGMVPYALGPGATWLATNKAVILALSLAVACALMLVAWRGLSIGKWVNNFGGFTGVLLVAAVILVAVLHWFRGTWAMTPMALSFPC